MCQEGEGERSIVRGAHQVEAGGMRAAFHPMYVSESLEASIFKPLHWLENFGLQSSHEACLHYVWTFTWAAAERCRSRWEFPRQFETCSAASFAQVFFLAAVL